MLPMRCRPAKPRGLSAYSFLRAALKGCHTVAGPDTFAPRHCPPPPPPVPPPPHPLSSSPDGQKKAYVRLTSDHDALDVANKIGII